MHRNEKLPICRLMTVALFFFCTAVRWDLGAPNTLPPAPVDVLVLHDSLPGPLPAGEINGYNVVDLLGHFGLKGSLVSISEYKPGDIHRYHFAFVLGVDERQGFTYPHYLLSDIRNATIPVFWMEGHLNELLSDDRFAERVGFKLRRPTIDSGFEIVRYKDQILPNTENTLFPLQILDNSKVQVFAAAEKKDGTSLPYIIRSGTFWYIADSPFSFVAEGDRYYAFCDVLHDFFRIPHQEEKKALLRIEDVTIEEDPDHLRSMADYLHSRNIPFQISLVPIYKFPAEKEEIYLSDRPEFVRAIRYMVSKGGTVVMHGATHQYHGKTGDDYEFWDAASDRPIQGDSRALVEQRLRMGLEECFKNGIYPATWETPHYMGSSLDYQAIGRYFSSSYERVSSINRMESGHYFPYPSVDRFGRFIIPECLGYISLENPNPDLMLANCDRLRVVRDGVASFFFHPFLDDAILHKLLDGIEERGYRFFSIRDYDIRVQMDERLVQTYSDRIQLPIQEHYLHRFLLGADGRITSESYSDKPIKAIFKDPGLVPDNSILVMEGVVEALPFKEPPPPGIWDTLREWLQKKVAPKAPEGQIIGQPRAMVLWDDSLQKGDWNNQQSYISALSAYGFLVSRQNLKNFTKSSLDSDIILVAPQAAALKISAAQTGWIAGFVRDGGRLVLDGTSPLSQELGIRPEKRILKIRNVSEMLYANREYKTSDLQWSPPAEVTRFNIKEKLLVYAQDKSSELPMAFVSRLGRGSYLYLAARLDPNTTLGYSRFPYFVHYVMEAFNVTLPAQRAQLELYYDPGSAKRGGADIDRRAETWRRMGIRAVYVGAFTFTPAWSFNYEHLIDVCHKNGILVYAWLELPHVSVKFWEDHPEWRAKTATGKDGLVGWRQHMDLDLPDCQEAVFAFVEDLLGKYPWDGVNIAELNYDTEAGPENPDQYLPMGSSTRTAFKALEGFDPVMLFKPESPYFWKRNPAALKKFEEYRTQRVVAWHRALLDRVMPLARERDMEIVVTVLDSLHSKNLTRDTGVDSKRIVELMGEYPFTLQVEDPAALWTDSPDRYRKFGQTYLGLVKDPARLMFDINVVPDREVEGTHIPTQTLAGIELAQTVLAAMAPTGRAAIYSEGTLTPEDLRLLGRVLAHNAQVQRQSDAWITDSDKSILLEAPGLWQNFRVDNQVWPGWGDNEVFIPAGKHRITAAEKKFSFIDTSALDLRLLRFTGNLDSLESTERGIGFTYDSPMRTLALFNRRPFEIRIDGRHAAEAPVPFSGHWSARLPRGAHKVEVIADSTATVILDTASLYSSHLIVVFGSVACGLMLLIYMAILVRRAFSRAVHGKAP